MLRFSGSHHGHTAAGTVADSHRVPSSSLAQPSCVREPLPAQIYFAGYGRKVQHHLNFITKTADRMGSVRLAKDGKTGERDFHPNREI